MEKLTFRALALRQSSDEGLTLETSAFPSLYGGQFTLSTLLINQIFIYNNTFLRGQEIVNNLRMIMINLKAGLALRNRKVDL